MFYFDQNCCCFDFVHTLSIFNLSTTNSYCFLYLVYAISIYIVPKIHNNNNIIIKNDNIVDLRVSETGRGCGERRENFLFFNSQFSCFNLLGTTHFGFKKIFWSL